MNASVCVGRVGGLAVALGVGVALFSGSGVALADRSDADGGQSSSASAGDGSGAASTRAGRSARTASPSSPSQAADPADSADPAEAARPVRGRPATVPWGDDGEPDAGALMAENARAFAEAHGAPWPPTVDGAQAVDDACEAWREARGMTPEQNDDDAEDGLLTVTGGAYAGEALRLAAGGAWAFVQRNEHMRAFVLRAGPQQNVTVNVLGKVQKHLRAGASDSTLSLVRVVVGRLRDGGF